ncbi:hypothetical protein Patl1_34014 [Pistacia atlantica]|uniref:Uncharacterized protein n=1 Tax=Pistacia atlantica TaxID=434234 RepID=A0ACC0ZQY9_9ROSI|nr:hypothetical protein Patl1_34014 [Pistacia atlantica]
MMMNGHKADQSVEAMNGEAGKEVIINRRRNEVVVQLLLSLMFLPSGLILMLLSTCLEFLWLQQLILCCNCLSVEQGCSGKFQRFPQGSHAWLIFALDQVFAYAMLSAGSAAASVTNLNRTGIKHTPLPNFCKALYRFCDHIAVSIAFTFFSSLLLAASVIQDVIWLTNTKS